jgi:hypothetical protein
MDWTLPSGFEVPFSGEVPSSMTVESYMTADEGGITILEGLSAAENQAEPAAVPGVTSAESFATWLAQRPFLQTSGMRTGEVDGRQAWIVDASVRPGMPDGPAMCNKNIRCYPIMVKRAWVVGMWDELTSRYTVLDLPGAGITVVWSWGFEGEVPTAADDVIASIHFH